MTDIVLACYRDAPGATRFREQLEQIAARLPPDNIRKPAPLVLNSGQCCLGLINPNPTVLRTRDAACVGRLVGTPSNWDQPGSPVPDGSFALVRSDAEQVEIAADCVGSRTLWYFFDEHLFLASTSQRALVMLRGRFHARESAIAWMLSSGALGPENCWDANVTAVAVGESIRIDRQRWTLSKCAGTALRFEPVSISEQRRKSALREAITEAMARMNLDRRDWVLPLSGGRDSRSLLLLCPPEDRLSCVTWGLPSARHNPNNDAAIAGRVAQAAGVPHRFFSTEPGQAENIAELLRRYIAASEGRCDHISGYMDGFALWGTFAREGIHGIVRGDHGMGGHQASSAMEVVRRVGLLRANDVRSLKDIEFPGRDDQVLPVSLARQVGESLPTWRDRLRLQFRFPVILAALNGIKAHYVEIANPLIARGILDIVLGMPDACRTEKRLFDELVSELLPDVPFAKSVAIERRSTLFRRPDFHSFLAAEISDPSMQQLFPARMCRRVLKRLQSEGHRDPAAGGMPGRLRRLLTPVTGIELDSFEIAFRMYLAREAIDMFSTDANALKHARPISRAPAARAG